MYFCTLLIDYLIVATWLFVPQSRGLLLFVDDVVSCVATYFYGYE